MSDIVNSTAWAPRLPPFTIAYQPIVNVPARRVAAYEALVRGERGVSYPQLVADMDVDTLRLFHHKTAEEAIRCAVALGLRERKASLTINLLPDRHPEALKASFIRGVANHYGLPLNRIILELTEDHHLDLKQLHELLEENREAGFASAMDDFGAGYSGLTALVETRPHVLKLDRELIRNIDCSEPRQRIVAAFMRVSAALNMTLVAEGVETLAEAKRLRQCGIKYMQGYFFSRPVINALPRFEECSGQPLEAFRGRKRAEDSGVFISQRLDTFTLQAGTA